MLNAVTNYLLLYKQVSIPLIGSFKIQQQPAQLDFASRLILPPAAEIIYTTDDEVNEQQLSYLSNQSKSSQTEVHSQLQILGEQLKSRLAEQAFEWKGIGYLQQQGNEVTFKSAFQNELAPVAAHKVLRENVSHAVTVGDKEMQSHEASELLQAAPPKSYLMLIVWLLIALALIFIGYLFYVKGFTPLSSGSQQQVGFLIAKPVLIG